MKTIKEKIAPAFQELAQMTRERCFYEACSIPWFVSSMDSIQEEYDVLYSGRDSERVLEIDDWRPPFKQFVLVLESKTGGVTVFVDKGGISGVCFGSYSRPVKLHQFVAWGRYSTGREDHEYKVAVKAAFRHVVAFCRLFQAGFTHVAAIRPINENKSVEWCKAQEHYVLLTSRHPANTDGGNQMNYDENEVIRRMAHRVRAHKRVLRSPRFRKKMGQTIWIQEQWRGPKEWINKRSRQIYRWIDKRHLNQLSSDGTAGVFTKSEVMTS